MLAKTIDRDMERHALALWDEQWTGRHRHPLRIMPKAGPAPEAREYTGFPKWAALNAGYEKRSADLLLRVNVLVYWPHFMRSICRRGRLRKRVETACMPRMLFVPLEMIDVENRDQVFAWAKIDGFVKRDGKPIILTKSDIEEIRRLEAKKNSPENPVDAKGNEIRKKQHVRFINPTTALLFGDGGEVFEVAGDNRIGVYVAGLFNGLTKGYFPADELEVI